MKTIRKHMFGNDYDNVFTFSALPAMFFGVQEGKGASILLSFSGSTLLPD